MSDWSSDVCSSDLSQACDQGIKAGQVRCQGRQASQARDQGSKAGQVRCQGRQASQARDQGSKAGRSEEHTSELQSLMRISYAVFCLKKNNRKNKQKTTNSQGIQEQKHKDQTNTK